MPRMSDTQRQRSSKTGFNPELWDACLQFQNNKCAICACELTITGKGELTNAHADHCHEVKLPRGILCAGCNMCLGVYEKHQRLAGLRIEAYETYLTVWPTRGFKAPARRRHGNAKVSPVTNRQLASGHKRACNLLRAGDSVQIDKLT